MKIVFVLLAIMLAPDGKEIGSFQVMSWNGTFQDRVKDKKWCDNHAQELTDDFYAFGYPNIKVKCISLIKEENGTNN